MLDILFYIQLSSGLTATTYGYGTMHCGDIGKPVACSLGATTASGEAFDPDLATAAVFAPSVLRMRPYVVKLKIVGPFRCQLIRINDKGNPRFIGKRSYDLTPAAVKKLGGRMSKHWSHRVELCGRSHYRP